MGERRRDRTAAGVDVVEDYDDDARTILPSNGAVVGSAPAVLTAHLSFWGEPFMARTAGVDVPRYIFHVQAHSELIGRLVELERRYRGTA